MFRPRFLETDLVLITTAMLILIKVRQTKEVEHPTFDQCCLDQGWEKTQQLIHWELSAGWSLRIKYYQFDLVFF